MSVLSIFSLQEMQSQIGTSTVGFYEARTRTYKYRLTGEAVESVNKNPRCSRCGKEGVHWHLIAAEEPNSVWAHLKLIDKDGCMIFWRRKTQQIICMHCHLQEERGIVKLSLEEVAERIRTKRHNVLFKGRQFTVSIDAVKRMMSDHPFCVACGRKADHWELKKRSKKEGPYLVLVDENGMIFTRDHIIPRSRYAGLFGTKDGRDSLHNSQVMCHECNGSKADSLPLVLPRIRIGGIQSHQLPLITEHIGDNNGALCQECDRPTVVTDEYLLICTHCGQRHQRFIGSVWGYWQDQEA